MPRTYKSGVTATPNQDAPVDPLRVTIRANGNGSHAVIGHPSATAVARGVIASPAVMAELLRLLAWTDRETLDRLRRAIDEAERCVEERREAYRTRPNSEW